MAASTDLGDTRFIYYIDEEETPYLVKLNIPPEKVTLEDFKNAINRPHSKYFFKSLDVDFGVVKEEIINDNSILPCFNGRVIAWLVTADDSTLSESGAGNPVEPSIPNGSSGNNNGIGSVNPRHCDSCGQNGSNSIYHSTSVPADSTSTSIGNQNSEMKCDPETDSVHSANQDHITPLRNFNHYKLGNNRLCGHLSGPNSHHYSSGRSHRHAAPSGSSIYDAPLSSIMSSDLESTSCFESEDESSRFSSVTGTTMSSRRYRRARRKIKRKRKCPLPISRASSFSSITDSTMSLNILAVTLNMETVNFLGISIVGQSNKTGDGGIYVGSIMKGGAVAQDGRIEPGDLILEVNGISFEEMSNDDAVRTLRTQVQRPGPITLIVAKCWDSNPLDGYFTLPRQDSIHPIDPQAWLSQTNDAKQNSNINPSSQSASPQCLLFLPDSLGFHKPVLNNNNMMNTAANCTITTTPANNTTTTTSVNNTQNNNIHNNSSNAMTAASSEDDSSSNTLNAQQHQLHHIQHLISPDNSLGTLKSDQTSSSMPLGTSAATFHMAALMAASKHQQQQQQQQQQYQTQTALNNVMYPNPHPSLQSTHLPYSSKTVPAQSMIITTSSSLPDLDNVQYSDLVPLNLSTDIPVVIRAMLRPNSGLDIHDRIWLKLTVPNAFIGSDVVDWIYKHLEGIADRKAARKYAANLLKLGYIRHIVNKMTFSEQCYYVFHDINGHLSCLSLEELDSVSEIGVKRNDSHWNQHNHLLAPSQHLHHHHHHHNGAESMINKQNFLTTTTSIINNTTNSAAMLSGGGGSVNPISNTDSSIVNSIHFLNRPNNIVSTSTTTTTSTPITSGGCTGLISQQPVAPNTPLLPFNHASSNTNYSNNVTPIFNNNNSSSSTTSTSSDVGNLPQSGNQSALTSSSAFKPQTSNNSERKICSRLKCVNPPPTNLATAATTTTSCCSSSSGSSGSSSSSIAARHHSFHYHQNINQNIKNNIWSK